MQGDFEKKIQEKMAALNLTPSAPVWDKIEPQIRPEKKRRRIFFWLFLFALLLGGGWWMVAPTKQQKDDSSLHKPAAAARIYHSVPVAHSSTSAPSPAQSRIAGAEPPFVKSNAFAGQSPQTFAVKKGMLQQNKKLLNRAQTGQLKNVINAEAAPVNFGTLQAEGKPIAAKNRIEARGKQPLERRENEPALSDIENKKAEPVQPLPADSTANSHTAPTKAKTLPDSRARIKIAAAGKRWQKLVTVQAGWSNYASGIALVPGANSRAASASYTPGASSGTSSQPADINKGFSFAVELGVTKPVKARVTVTAGLQFAYYSVHTNVGEFKRLDTAVLQNNNAVALNGYYRSNQLTDRRFSFYLLSLPVSVAYQPVAKLPLQLSAGFSYGRMLGSNALTFHPYNNISYYDKSNNNQDYLNLLAGLIYRVVAKPGLAITVGPQVQYSVTRVQKQYYGQPAHLFFAGIKSSIHF